MFGLETCFDFSSQLRLIVFLCFRLTLIFYLLSFDGFFADFVLEMYINYNISVMIFKGLMDGWMDDIIN